MERHCCNSTGGWMRVAYVNMTDPNEKCPSGFSKRTDDGVTSCGKNRTNCISTTFSSQGIGYSRVCGRVRAYQYGWTDAFDHYDWPHWSNGGHYPDGITITHGICAHQHIWSFVAARSEYYSNDNTCPCTRTDQPYTGAVPPPIGECYFCDTAAERFARYEFYPDDPLWDGQGCGPTSTCCSFNKPPWFCKQLPRPTIDDIQLTMCAWWSRAQTPFDQVEIYIQ